MATENPQDKGNALEEAVRLIEQRILENTPLTKDAIVTMEPKKIVVIDDVKHEIDIFVTIDLGKGYKSTYIFECKNWEEAVGKNEIIVFSEKIDAVQAQKGYFIAKQFGKYAEAQAKKDRRIELLLANTDLDKLPPFLEDGRFHYLQDNILHSDIYFRCKTIDPQKVGTLQLTNESKVVFNGVEISLSEFNQQVQRMVESEVMNHEPTETFEEGTYKYDETRTFTYKQSELVVDGNECQELTAKVIWDATVIRNMIAYKIDIQTRGRVIKVVPASLPPGIDIKMLFVDVD